MWLSEGESRKLMQINEHIRASVVFLDYVGKKTGEIQRGGTAFLVTYPFAGLGNRTKHPPPALSEVVTRNQHRCAYLVTAGHVIRGIHAMSRDQLVIIRANKLGFGGTTDDSVPTASWHSLLPLDGALGPDDEAKDVAVFRFNGRLPGIARIAQLDLFDVPIEAGAFEDRRFDTNMNVGDDVAIIGLFPQHSGSWNNIPVVRTGTIAAMPEEPISTTIGMLHGYLVEAHSVGGLSGSPVFFHLQGPRVMGPLAGGEKLYTQPELYLLGLMSGHWDLRPDASKEAWEKAHSGMSVVTPVETIVEALEMPEVKKERDKEAQEADMADRATMDFEDESFGRDKFMADLRRATTRVEEQSDPEASETEA